MEKDFSQLDEILEMYRGKPGILIPLLQDVQNLLGYLPKDAMRYIAQKMNIPAQTSWRGNLLLHVQAKASRQAHHPYLQRHRLPCIRCRWHQRTLIDALQLPKGKIPRRICISP